MGTGSWLPMIEASVGPPASGATGASIAYARVSRGG